LKPDIQPHEEIREYLLGRFASADAAILEERLLIDDAFYQELLIIEDELVDQYLAGRLTDSDQRSFEGHFLIPLERREKLRFARNLKKYVSRAGDEYFAPAPTAAGAESTPAVPSPVSKKTFWPRTWKRPILSYSLAAAATAAVLVLAFAAPLIVKNLIPPQQGTGTVLAVELVPGRTRGDEETKQITVTAGTNTVQLQLRIPNDVAHQAYRAILQTTDGREILRQENIRPDPASNDRVICPIPANLLKPSDYDLKLSGRNQQGEYEDVSRYYFRVTR
jgi:hypothetical protein